MNPIDISRLAWRTATKRYPEQVTFFVTSRCNFRCKMCFYVKEASAHELTLAEYERIAKQMPNFHWMLISGGEPFLRDELPQICRTFVENNRVRKINLPTNAYFPERIVPMVKEILEIRPDCFLNLGLSLHAPGKKHDEITGVPGSFERVMQTHQALQPLRRQFKNLGLSIVIVHCSYTESDMKELIRFIFDEMDIDDICIALARGTPRMAGSMSFSPDLYAQNCLFLHNLIHAHREYYFNLPFKGLFVSKDIVLRDVIFQTLRQRSFQIPCYAGRISAVIDETGNLYACELRSEKIGNLRDAGYRFKTLWEGTARKELLHDIRANRCFCTHECTNTTNILFNPRLYGRLSSTWLRLHTKGWGLRRR
ncbi:MAG: radical SAM protein [Candidatus Aureabacteria bacterium]|nr:radical SAM protein [Candidatus Auribacterota bacterium]